MSRDASPSSRPNSRSPTHSRSNGAAFADVLRENAKAMTTMHDQMMHDGATASAPEHGSSTRSRCCRRGWKALKAIAGAETTLYAVLSDEQKKTADELLSTPMGTM